MQQYPSLSSTSNDAIASTVRRIVDLRNQDVVAYNNLSNIFMSGRRVYKIPANSADVSSTDRELDFNYDGTYFYYALEITGSITWRRIAHGSF